MRMEWLSSYIETVTTGSINRAAERLHLTQPGVWQHLRKLEQALGVRLLERTPSGVKPTDAGAVFLQRAQQLHADWRAAQDELAPFRGAARTAAVGALPSLAAGYLPARAARLLRRGYRLDVRVAHTSEELLRRLQAGELDAALLESGYASAAPWSAELFREPLLAVLPQAHPLASRSALRLDDLAAEPLVAYPPECDIRRRVERLLRAKGLEPRIGLEVTFGDYAPGYVESGAGIAILPEISVRHIPQRDLAVRPLADVPEQRSVSLAARNPGLGRQLCAFMKEL